MSSGTSSVSPRGTRPARLFLCFSRSDGGFVSQLQDELSTRGYISYYDVPHLDSYRDAKNTIIEMIAEADAVIFVISIESMKSEICKWEMEEAIRLHKRIIPIVIESGSFDFHMVPAPISRLNFIFLDESAKISERIKYLILSIESDGGWICQHTHLTQQASLWRANDQGTDYLLRGKC